MKCIRCFEVVFRTDFSCQLDDRCRYLDQADFDSGEEDIELCQGRCIISTQ